MKKKSLISKIGLILLLLGLVLAARSYGLQDYLTLEFIKSNQQLFYDYYQTHQFQTLLLYFVLYVFSTALSIPGATLLTLLAGALFGFSTGLIIVSFASSLGATLAFLLSRFLLRDWVQQKFGTKLKTFNEGVKKEGAFYLLSMRLIPLFPFFLINIAMGLTPVRTLTFFFVSQLGMLPGTAVYVNAGKQLSEIDSLKGILSTELIISFALLGLFPLVAKKIVAFLKAKRVYKDFKKPKKFDYNMIVIGGGSAGLVTSYISAAVKAKVALIEKHKMGGDCLNTGCVPSKALIKSAKVLSLAKRSKDFGLDSIEVHFSFSDVMERVQRIIKKIEPHDSIDRYTNLGVECIEAEAKIISPWEVEVNGKVLTTKNITVATGARPFVPQIPGIEKVDYLVSDNLWNLRELPQKFLVLGGGPIGCEIAQCFARFGSKVTQVEMAPRIMGIEDEEVSAFVERKLINDGVEVLTHHKALEFRDAKTLVCEFNAKEVLIEFDKVLIAVGRKANVSGFGLEELGVVLRENGTIEANDFLQTNFPNIYVCGDVTGPYQLTHTAAHQAWYAAVNGLFGSFKKFKVDYSVIPWCTYTDPEVATVGLNEVFAQRKGMKKGIDYEVTEYEIDDLDRAITEDEDYGFVKVLTVPGRDKILGATIVGSSASTMIIEFVAAMKQGFGMNAILGTIHIYPTMGEANKYAAGVWKKAHAPEKLLNYLEKFHHWMRGS